MADSFDEMGAAADRISEGSVCDQQGDLDAMLETDDLFIHPGLSVKLLYSMTQVD